MTTRIEIGITHEVVIKGEKSWVRLSIADDYDMDAPLRGVGLDQAVSELSAKVNKKLIDVVEETIATIDNYENK